MKRFIKRIPCVRILNALILRAATLLAPVVPDTVLRRIPVVGQFRLRLPNSQEVCLKTDGYDRVANEVYGDGIDGFEKSTMRLFLQLLEQVGTFLDIGAGTGIYSLIAAVDDGQREIYSFEPVPRVRARFETNVKLNGLSNIRVFPNALSDRDGEIDLYVPAGPVPMLSSTLQGFREASEVLRVQGVTVDAFVADHDIPSVDLMKIDTEATEHQVLQGAVKTIQRDAPVIICEVLRGRTEQSLHSVMDDLGYRYFWISSEGLVEKERIAGDEASRELNYLFLPKGKAQEILQKTENLLQGIGSRRVPP
ncbi:MAG: hypothetical protein A2V70_08210 [Planctomycetes bacterium RBG_13_63_9]|nr:MAG: hypothetical protein A2V70_08210 [Planctomycetes bacterium RBG_13_63_9]